LYLNKQTNKQNKNFCVLVCSAVFVLLVRWSVICFQPKTKNQKPKTKKLKTKWMRLGPQDDQIGGAAAVREGGSAPATPTQQAQCLVPRMPQLSSE